MKADESNSSETIWACLHGELDANAQNAFEQEMARDSGLRERFEASRQMDLMLRATLAALGTDDMTGDAIDVQALAAWEREHTSASQPMSDFPKVAPRGLFLRRSAFGVAGLAAAAALVLVVSPALQSPGGVMWTEPVFAPLTLRGAGNSSESVAHVPALAASCQKVLSAALEKTLAARSCAVPRTTLSLRLQELRRGGAFSVVVTAVQRDGQTVGEWSGDYSGMEAFLSQADASAVRIAATLDPSGNTSSQRGQP